MNESALRPLVELPDPLPRPVDHARIARAVREILLAIGEDPERDGLAETPARVARSLAEMTAGLRADPRAHLRRTFATEHRHGGLVLVRQLEFSSLCEHHLLPFWGEAHVAYLPARDRVVGLSKLARALDDLARRPQVQERLGESLATAIEEELGAAGVAVVLEAQHMCMGMRGARQRGAITTTVASRGQLRDPERRAELFALIRGAVVNVVVAGATGFIGRALVLRLRGEGHAVIALVRAPDRARDLLPAGVAIVSIDDELALRAALAEADAVVNLAGENVAGGRWSAARRRALRASRIDVTRRIVDAIETRFVRLPVLVSASAIGWYGDRGDDELVESAPSGSGFLAELCRDWEAAAAGVGEHAQRVVRVRIGVVLGLEGGMLGTLLPIYRRGLGGRIGRGQQWLSWIHLDDAVAGILRAITDRAISGPVNLVAPEPVRQRDFARALAAAVGRRANLPVPRAALALALGRAATVALASQRVVPAALARSGFTFRHPNLAGALADLVGADGVTIRPADLLPDAAYVQARRPRHTLTTRTVIDAPLAEVFEFFSAAENLAAITPPALGFTIRTPRPVTMAAGATIDYSIRASGVPLRWRTTIEAWEPGVRFVDSQARGPYRAWWHEHHFLADGSRTIMDDVVHYAAPFGVLGRLANGYVTGMLRRIFAYRQHAIRARFPARAAAVGHAVDERSSRPGASAGAA